MVGIVKGTKGGRNENAVTRTAEKKSTKNFGYL